VITVMPAVFPAIVVTRRVPQAVRARPPIHSGNPENSNLKALWNSSSHFFADLVR
jgi:hypothetical protein